MTVKQYQLEVLIGKQLFYNDESMYGIYSCKPVHYNEEIQLNRFNSFSLKGETRKLLEGESYVIKFEGTFPNSNPRYDDYYQIIEVEPEKLDTVDQQDKFLQAILTEKQFNSLKEAYPRHLLVDLILDNKIDTNKTKGIKDKTLAKIKIEVEQNAQISVLIAKLNTLNLSTSALNRLLNHFRTPEAVIRAIDEDIYNLCVVPSMGFKTIDKSALERGDNPTNGKRIAACLKYILQQDNQEGHTWTLIDTLIADSTELLGITQDLIKQKLDRMKETGELYVDTERVALKHIRKQEIDIRNHLWRIHSAYISPSKTRVKNRIAEVEAEQGFKFTEEQKNAIIESSQDGVSVINGGGGVGKTTIVKGLIKTLGTDNYMATTLSGKATSILSKTGVNASTIHRMLGYDGRYFAFDETEQLPYDIIIVDEASMVSVSLFLSILRAAKDGVKILIVGDSGQLPAIGHGDLLYDLLSSKVFPIYELTQVHRQAAKSGILSLANSIRRGQKVVTYNSSGSETYGELRDQTVITYSKETKDNISNDILKIAESYKSKIKTPEDLLDFQVFVTNRDRGALSVLRMNIELQKIFNDMSKPFISRGGYDYRENDKVIAVGNSYKLKSYHSVEEYVDSIEELSLDEEAEAVGDFDVFNGTMGIIKEIRDKITFIQFEGSDRLVVYSQTELEKISLAYAITVHRGQGSGIPNTILALDYSAFKLLTKQLVYTGITRASEKGLVLAENNALYTALQNDANTRRTFLKELLEASERK